MILKVLYQVRYWRCQGGGSCGLKYYPVEAPAASLIAFLAWNSCAAVVVVVCSGVAGDGEGGWVRGRG